MPCTDDRSEIEDLQARYLFALDFHDPDLYISTFTDDGILDVGSGEIKGRDAIKQTIARMPQPAAAPGLFAKRRIYNENRDEWAYKGAKNPAW